MITVTVRHRFEAAHRLPHLGGKCASLHGHSWLVAVEAAPTGPLADGVVADMRALKQVFGGWVDEHLDHAALLGADDPLVPPLMQAGCRVYPVGCGPESVGLVWPTVETVAALLANVARQAFAILGAEPVRVQLTETATSAATWSRP